MDFDDFESLSPQETLPSLEDQSSFLHSVHQNVGESVFHPVRPKSNSPSGSQNVAQTFPTSSPASAPIDASAGSEVSQEFRGRRKQKSAKRKDTHSGHGTSCLLCERGKRKCNGERPCTRCIRIGKPEQCCDGTAAKRRKTRLSIVEGIDPPCKIPKSKPTPRSRSSLSNRTGIGSTAGVESTAYSDPPFEAGETITSAYPLWSGHLSEISNPCGTRTTFASASLSRGESVVSESEGNSLQLHVQRPAAAYTASITLSFTAPLMTVESVKLNSASLPLFGFSEAEISALWKNVGEMVFFHPSCMRDVFAECCQRMEQGEKVFSIAVDLLRKESITSAAETHPRITVTRPTATLLVTYYGSQQTGVARLHMQISNVQNNTSPEEIDVYDIRRAWLDSRCSLQNFFQSTNRSNPAEASSVHHDSTRANREDATYVSPFEALGLVRQEVPQLPTFD
eukprot:gb/GECG01008643.1/.p1 GENE.gb/GECG01008643.1/~~gb/GECG01008643.1/.p1  ORF type:complete len:453 (+),score=42.89 gb/GECG01008643.1/:1-1359(+)